MATVLVVDDLATNREVARMTLDDGGHRVIEAAEGRQALDLARRLHPDVVLTDVIMPGMDGYEFVHELRADVNTAGIPVLLYTANYAPDEAEPLASAYGVTKVVAKSADPAALLAAVEQALHDGPPPVGAPADVATEHLRTVNAKLVQKVLALDESEVRFQTLADLSPVGIVSGGADLRAAYVNPRLSDITGEPDSGLLGHGWLRCVPAEHRAALRADGPPTGQADYHGKVALADGRHRWMHTRVRTTETDGEQAGFVATIDDVTTVVEAEERRHADERRRITERFDSLARLSGAVAHDFNNMLNIILSFSEFTQESLRDAVDTHLRAADADPILADLDKIHRAGQRAARLAHQLLTFGGREVVQPTVLAPNALVDEVRDLAEATIGAQITIVTDLDPHVRNTVADGSQLTQVLLNLADNARDAMAHGGTLTLRTGMAPSTTPAGLPPGDYVCIAVRDTGEGMTPDVAERAVEPFFTTRPKGHGTGLGLATAFGIVRQAGGELVIDSAPGRGTTVTLYLPATDRPVPATASPTPARVQAGQTILLAEDETGVREVAARILTRNGYHVLSAANGQEALEIARSHPGPIHGVLSDVVMPHMNGPELAEALRTVRPDTPVLYMSGFAGPLMTEQGLLEPGVTVVGKPFTSNDLLTAVYHTLAGATDGQPVPAGATSAR
jgi:two-component system cell cycle sensor histidine kinase/response regulator CckA